MQIDKHMNWETHIGQITPKLSMVCYAVRYMCYLTNIGWLLMIYYAYFHAVMTYGIMFWGSSTDVKRVFKFQKKAVGIMMG
jgi:hypothetical protein